MRFASLLCSLVLQGAVVAVAMQGAPAGAADLTMSYSGRLIDSKGAPLKNSIDITATFFDALVEGNQLGLPMEMPKTLLNAGIFQVLLTFKPQEAAAVFGNGQTPVFIQITAGDHEYPRQQLTYAPFAMRVPVDNTTLAFNTDGNLSLMPPPTSVINPVLTVDSNGNPTWGSSAAHIGVASAAGNLTAGSTSIAKVPGNTNVTPLDANKTLLMTAQSTVNLPSASQAGAGFTIRIKNSNASIVTVQPVTNDQIDGATGPLFLYVLGAGVDLMSDGKAWYITNSVPTIGRLALPMCGNVGNSCYDNVAARAAGAAVTPTGKLLFLISTTSGLQLWQEQNGRRILHANGLDAWQMALTPAGSEYSNNYFYTINSLSQRVCPTNVYVDDAHKFTTNNCIFYSYASDTYGTYNEYGTSQTVLGQIGMAAWTTPKWYAGNTEVCARQFMRLPVLYEGSGGDPGTNTPLNDGVPVFASTSTGIPQSSGYTKTATTAFSNNNLYFSYCGGGNGCAVALNYYDTGYHPTVCALP